MLNLLPGEKDLKKITKEIKNDKNFDFLVSLENPF